MHTRGPWKVSGFSSPGGFLITSKSGDTIAYCESTYLIKEKKEYGDYNSNLIAAAPELLEALESAMNYINRYGGEVTSSFRSGGWGEYVDSVIRKARGL
jgi:hypothetical protein